MLVLQYCSRRTHIPNQSPCRTPKELRFVAVAFPCALQHCISLNKESAPGTDSNPIIEHYNTRKNMWTTSGVSFSYPLKS